MLRSNQFKKYILGFSALLLLIGIVLSGTAIAIGDSDFNYLRAHEDRWYQLISIDDDNVLSIGIVIDDKVISGGKINLNND